MAKSKRRQSSASSGPQTESPAVERALHRLLEFYEDGLAVIAAVHGSTRRQLDPRHVVRTFAQKHDRSPDYFWQARKFADAYDDEQFEELCSLRRPDGNPLTPSHVRHLLSIRDRRRRKGFQSRVIKEGWSPSRLSDEIHLIQTSSSTAGRPFRKPASVDDALLQVANVTGHMLRWVKVLDPSKDGDAEGEITLDDLPESVRKELKSATRIIRRLHDSALGELGQDAEN